MDNQRLLVWAFFGVMLFLTWQAWVEDYGTKPSPATSPAVEDTTDTDMPVPGLPELPAADTPDSAAPELPADAPPLPADATQPSADAGRDSRTVSVVTDVLELEIDTRGGTLARAVLDGYPVAKDQPDVLVQLLSPARDDLGLIHTGIRVRPAETEPDQSAEFEVSRERFELGNDDVLEVPLSWTDGAGLSVEKVYRFRRGSYIIEVEQRLRNDSAEPRTAGAYAQIRRRAFERERSMFDVDTYSFDGPIIYDGDKSEKLDRDDLIDDGPYEFRSSRGWLAAIQHHFLSAVVPPPDSGHTFSVSVRDNVAISSMIGPAATIAPGAEEVFTMTVFVGPKLQSQLEEVDETLKLTVDYGWLTIISNPLFWLLSFTYSFVGNWGLAIIIVTILIKLVFYKLTEASGRSMAKMREIQPRMKALQERYKDDRQALSQAMMELYKREKVNPAAGCLPILIQMPFFLAFYWVLLESVEMRQAPFALWITDLSARDPFFILPLIMGAAMLFQQKLNPAPADPVQARVMQIMPIMFTVFFAFFPSGLVLYWVTNTVLSIGQQWYINKVVAEESKKAKSGGKGGGKKNKKKDG